MTCGVVLPLGVTGLKEQAKTLEFFLDQSENDALKVILPAAIHVRVIQQLTSQKLSLQTDCNQSVT
jgi:hypothetical protein